MSSDIPGSCGSRPPAGVPNQSPPSPSRHGAHMPPQMAPPRALTLEPPHTAATMLPPNRPPAAAPPLSTAPAEGGGLSDGDTCAACPQRPQGATTTSGKAGTLMTTTPTPPARAAKAPATAKALTSMGESSGCVAGPSLRDVAGAPLMPLRPDPCPLPPPPPPPVAESSGGCVGSLGNASRGGGAGSPPPPPPPCAPPAPNPSPCPDEEAGEGSCAGGWWLGGWSGSDGSWSWGPAASCRLPGASARARARRVRKHTATEGQSEQREGRGGAPPHTTFRLPYCSARPRRWRSRSARPPACPANRRTGGGDCEAERRWRRHAEREGC